MNEEPEPPHDKATEAELALNRAMIRSSRRSLAVDRQIVAASREAIPESRRRLDRGDSAVLPLRPVWQLPVE